MSIKLQIKRQTITDMVEVEGSNEPQPVKRDSTPPIVDFNHGEYRRRFERKDEPFVIQSEDEADMLMRSDSFEAYTEPPATNTDAAAEAAATNNSGQTSKRTDNKATGKLSAPQEQKNDATANQ